MIFDAIEVFIRYGLSWGAVAVLLVRNRRLRRYINNHLPKLLRDHTDGDIAEIKRDVKAIKSHLGVVECGDIKTSSSTEARSYRRLSLLLQMVKNRKNRRRKRMKAYLKKLGSRKFQSLLVSLIVNIGSAILFMTGTVDVDSVINGWMPIINMTILTISTWVYLWVEGGIDKATIQKEVVVIEKEVAPSDNLNIPIEPPL